MSTRAEVLYQQQARHALIIAQTESGRTRVSETGYEPRGMTGVGPDTACVYDGCGRRLRSAEDDDVTQRNATQQAMAAASSASDDGIIQATSGGSISGREFLEERRSPRAMAGYQAPQVPRRWPARVAQKLERWVFLYNVTTGLYMLDWWERCIFNVVFIVLFVLVGYNSGHYLQHMGARLVAWAWWGDSGKELAGAGARASGG